MALDKMILYLVAGFACLYICFMLFGLIAILPYGLPGLVVLGIFLYVLVRIIRDRLGNKEDDYYEKNIKQ